MLALILWIAPWFQASDGLLQDLAGPDREAQGVAIEALASALDHPEPGPEIAAALAGLAEESDDPQVRGACLDALGRRGDDASLTTLSELIHALPPREQTLAASALGGSPAGRARAWELLVRALEMDAGATPLAELVRVGATSLAERGGGAWTSAELSPFARLVKSADPLVSESVVRAVEGLIDVFEQTGGRRALSFLDALSEAGYRADLVAEHLCDIGLRLGATEVVLEAAGALSDGTFQDTDLSSRARGLGYLATARFVDGEYEAAAALFVEQRDVAEALSKLPLSGRSNFGLRAIATQLAATAEVGLALSLLANGAEPGDSEVRGAARRSHVFALRSHVLGVRGEQGAFGSLDFLFGSHPAPWRVLAGSRVLPRLGADESMKLRREFLAALATVAPRELPGITPLTDTDLPTTSGDPERLGLVFEVFNAREERLVQRLEEASRRGRRLSITGKSDPELREEITRLERELRSMRDQRQWPTEELLQAIRTPSNVALDFAASLRMEGRHSQARALLESFLADMEEGKLLQRYPWAIESVARAETSLGSCLSDEDRPEEAERLFLQAVERLEDLENLFVSRGMSPAVYRHLTSMRAGVLISLAVNANVRLGDPERALGYFERAYSLRHDAFTTVLLACYRARSGREAEARDALAQVVPEPNLYYNLACTHALLGDTTQALSFLALEFSVNQTTRGARGRQKAWARDDPDLRSLREDPRFQELTSER